MNLIFFAATLTVLSYTTVCCWELSWNTYKGMEYALVTTKSTWIEAQRYCSQHVGVLAQPESADINNYLKSLTDKKTWLWIGASNLPDKKTWEWHNPLKAITYSDWQSSQPDANSTQNCLLYWFSNEGYKWGDYYCNKKFGFLCQRTKVSANDSDCKDRKPANDSFCKDKKPANQKCMTICL
ncbi:perlucin-like protein [Mytilus californianus]|uniref:perlucin-like protein n=1 Tax=Mytilus californianus TaxID=6549 RepID=UPI002246FE60|nr:perlucin-like protein [Mytilus californianus]